MEKNIVEKMAEIGKLLDRFKKLTDILDEALAEGGKSSANALLCAAIDYSAAKQKRSSVDLLAEIVPMIVEVNSEI